MKKSILAFVAHADDLEMSMGGTCLKYLEQGYEIHIVYSTNNMSGGYSSLQPDGRITSRNVPPEEEMQIRKKEAEEAAALFNTKPVHLDFLQRHYFVPESNSKVKINYEAPLPDCIRKDALPILTAHENADAVKNTAELIREWDPEVILTLGPADPNLEHIATGYLAMKAQREAAKSGYDGSLLFCMTPAPAGIAPMYDAFDTFIDTTGFMEKKYDAVRIHKSQKPVPEALDFRDFTTGSRCQCETAEPFIIGSLSKVRTGPFTAEIVRNHFYCMENFRRIFS